MIRVVYLVRNAGAVYHIRGRNFDSVCRCVGQALGGPDEWTATWDRPTNGRLCDTCAQGLGYHGA